MKMLEFKVKIWVKDRSLKGTFIITLKATPSLMIVNYYGHFKNCFYFYENRAEY